MTMAVMAVVVSVACALTFSDVTRARVISVDQSTDYTLAGPCSPGNHTVVDDVTRDVTYGKGLACDYNLQHVWYRFTLNGSAAVLPTSCVQFEHCGTYDPVWMDLEGQPLPAVGQQREVKACANNLPDCCAYHWTFTVLNCGSFFVYRLASTPGCYFRYCVQTAA